MKWTLSELHRYQDEPLQLKRTLDLADAIQERFPNQVLALAPVEIDGYVTYDDGDATLYVRVQTTVTVPSTRSLEPVELPLDFEFTEHYLNGRAHLDRYEDTQDLVFPLEDGNETIDLDESLLENIFEQIPTKVLTPDEAAHNQMPNGKGWAVHEEGEQTGEDTQSVDPRFAKLKELFPDQD